jgi:hypothetical protein
MAAISIVAENAASDIAAMADVPIVVKSVESGIAPTARSPINVGCVAGVAPMAA